MKEPTYTERREASQNAKRELMRGWCPRPSVAAVEVVPWAVRRDLRIRDLAARPRPRPARLEVPAPAPPEPEVPVSPRRPTVEPVRFSVVSSLEFAPTIPCVVATGRRKAASKAWRVRTWREGLRHCAYCAVRMTLGAVGRGKRRAARQNARPPMTLATVDHREPLALGGDDAPWNWVLACWACNNRKGQMTEAQFRATLSAERRA